MPCNVPSCSQVFTGIRSSAWKVGGLSLLLLPTFAFLVVYDIALRAIWKSKAYAWLWGLPFLMIVFMRKVGSSALILLLYMLFNGSNRCRPIGIHVLLRACVNSSIIHMAFSICQIFCYGSLKDNWRLVVDIPFALLFPEIMYRKLYIIGNVKLWHNSIVALYFVLATSCTTAAIAFASSDTVLGRQTLFTFCDSPLLAVLSIRSMYQALLGTRRIRPWDVSTDTEDRLNNSFYSNGVLVVRELFSLRTPAIFVIVIYIFDRGYITTSTEQGKPPQWNDRAESLSFTALLAISLFSSFFPRSTTHSCRMLRMLLNPSSSREGAFASLHNSRAAYHAIQSDDAIASQVAKGYGCFLRERSHLYKGKWRAIVLAWFVWEKVKGQRVRQGVGRIMHIDPDGTREVRRLDLLGGDLLKEKNEFTIFA